MADEIVKGRRGQTTAQEGPRSTDKGARKDGLNHEDTEKGRETRTPEGSPSATKTCGSIPLLSSPRSSVPSVSPWWVIRGFGAGPELLGGNGAGAIEFAGGNAGRESEALAEGGPSGVLDRNRQARRRASDPRIRVPGKGDRTTETRRLGGRREPEEKPIRYGGAGPRGPSLLRTPCPPCLRGSFIQGFGPAPARGRFLFP